MNCQKCGATAKIMTASGVERWACGSTQSFDEDGPSAYHTEFCEERAAHAETRAKLEESDAAARAAEANMTRVYRWIESHSQDGFIDSQGYAGNLDRIFDSMYDRMEESDSKARKRKVEIIKLEADLSLTRSKLEDALSATDAETHYELEGLVTTWRLIASHPTLEKAQADMADYKEWSKDAVAAWKCFRLVKVTTCREIIIP